MRSHGTSTAAWTGFAQPDRALPVTSVPFRRQGNTEKRGTLGMVKEVEGSRSLAANLIDLWVTREEELGARSHGGHGDRIGENQARARKKRGKEQLGGR